MKFEKSQVAKILLLLLFLLVIRLVSSSLKPSYLYFLLLNLIILALATESGFLRNLSAPSDQGNKPTRAIVTPSQVVPCDPGGNNNTSIVNEHQSSAKAEEKLIVDKKVVIGIARVHKLRRSPSLPSLFFIGNLDNEVDVKGGEEGVEEDAEEVADVGAEELLVRAEVFIANFYKQLKMQREGSWNKIHGLYPKPF